MRQTSLKSRLQLELLEFTLKLSAYPKVSDQPLRTSDIQAMFLCRVQHFFDSIKLGEIETTEADDVTY